MLHSVGRVLLVGFPIDAVADDYHVLDGN